MRQELSVELCFADSLVAKYTGKGGFVRVRSAGVADTGEVRDAGTIGWRTDRRAVGTAAWGVTGKTRAARQWRQGRSECRVKEIGDTLVKSIQETVLHRV